MVSESATAPPSLPEPPRKLTPAEKRRAERAAAVAIGKCSNCAVRDPKPGGRQCAVCLASAAKSAKKKADRVRAEKLAAKTGVAIAAQPVAPAAPVTVSSVFEPFAAQLRAIDWRDPVKREAEVGAIFGQMFVAVALAPSLTDADRERLQWLQSLARQMVAFRDASAIEAARRALSGEDAPKPEDTDGPGLEPTIAVEVETRGPDNSEADGERTRQTFRGRPRARTFS